MQIECFERGLKGSEQADGEADAARGLEDVDAAANAGNGSGQIGGAAFEKLRPVVAKEFAREAGRELRRDGLARGAQGAANPQRRRKAGFEMEVAGALLARGGDEGFEGHWLRLIQ